jgi:hypothetical protein
MFSRCLGAANLDGGDDDDDDDDDNNNNNNNDILNDIPVP